MKHRIWVCLPTIFESGSSMKSLYWETPNLVPFLESCLQWSAGNCFLILVKDFKVFSKALLMKPEAKSYSKPKWDLSLRTTKIDHLHFSKIEKRIWIKCENFICRWCRNNRASKGGEIYICCIITWTTTIYLVQVIARLLCL